MNPENIKLICFDLDGTLVDSVPDLAAAVNCMQQDLELETYSEDTIRGWVGNGAGVLVQRALSGDFDIDPELSEALYNDALTLFLSHYSKNVFTKSTLYPNVQATLSTLHSAGYKLAIVTNKPLEQTHPVLEQADIIQYFSAVLGGDSLANKKPHPEPLLHCRDKEGLTTDQVLMVGDSKNDIIAAQAATMASVGLTYGYNYGEPISDSNPEFVIDDISELTAILNINKIG